VDLGAGGFYVSDQREQRAGAFLSVGAVLARHNAPDWNGRLVPELQARLVDAPGRAQVGWGAAARLNYEWASFIPAFPITGGPDAIAYGVGQGEFGFSVFVEAATSQVGAVPTYLTTVGLCVRLPAIAGVMVVPIRN
jgi:hypothetical protein